MERIIAIDFDGTIVENKFPEIGNPINGAFKYMKKLQGQGFFIVLWTCRAGESLEDAIRFCGEQGLVFDSINANSPSNLAEFDYADTRKVFAHYYIDDRQIGGLPSWEDIYGKIIASELKCK